MKKTLLLTLMACFLLSLAGAQSIKISGVVVDSTGTPLQMANVIAYQKDKNLGGFGITNDLGKYQLQGLKKDSTYVLKVSFLGLKTIEDTVRNVQGDLVRNYVMYEDENTLDAVNIVYDMPVSIKGDTIVYNSDSFTNGTERKLGDVLEKLPGVEVNEDGDIQVEGKTVEKVMVDGKEFFAGDSRLATKNIPADAVGKVEVL
ncbi:MAG: carboxypeptidase regulatory-like domain-containing protein, partial [Nonlabens sp.]